MVTNFHQQRNLGGRGQVCNISSVESTIRDVDFAEGTANFSNGERRRFDARPLLAMKPWNRIASPPLFERVSIRYGTVVWPGEIDVAPETLYDDSVPIT